MSGLVNEQGYNSSNIGYLAFTRAAAEVAKERLKESTGKDFEWCRTLHSTALRLIDLPRNSVINPRWHYPMFSRQTGLRLTYHDAFEDVDREEDDYGIVLRLYDIARNRELNPEEILSEMPIHPLLQEEPRKYFWKMWQEFKETHGLIDYLDILERFVYTDDNIYYPCPIVFLDEAQDLSSVQWKVFNKLIRQASEVYLAGDDDQCQPPGTLVRVQGGLQKPIEELNPSTDKLMVYSKNDSAFYGKRTGQEFRIAARQYSGHLFNINGSRCTPQHRWFVKWNKNPGWCVYLMRKGEWWRCGMAKMFRSDGICHPWNRARVEGAEELYILEIYPDERSARISEQIVSVKYNIPQWTWENSYSKEELDKMYNSINEIKYKECLNFFKRTLPFASKGQMYLKRSGNTIWEQNACNIFQNYMMVGRFNGASKISWEPATVSIEENYSGAVYSLDVKKYHSYIADDIASHNSIYGFSGGSEYGFLNYSSDEEVVLEKSYRVPKLIGNVADKIINRVEHRKDKRVTWRDDPGYIEYSRFPIEFLPWHIWSEESKSVMALCRTRNIVGQVSRRLRDMNVLHMRDGDSILKNKEAKVIKSYYDIASGKRVRPKIVAQVLDAAGMSDYAREIRSRGIESRVLKLHRDQIDFDWDCDDLVRLFGDGYTNIQEFVRRHGVGILDKETNVNVMTMHKAKGKEADIVVIFTDCTQKIKDQEFSPSEIRIAYVALTRAKERVIVMPPDTRTFITHFD